MISLIRKLDRAYGYLLRAMMWLAALYVGFMMLLVIYVALWRELGWRYNEYAFTAVEYGFIYVLMLGGPWLVRTRGHVFIEIVTAAVSDRVRNVLSRFVALLAAVICLGYGWLSYEQLLVELDRGLMDQLRTDLHLPRWYTTSFFIGGFALMGLEFVRFVFGRQTFHTGQAGVHE